MKIPAVKRLNKNEFEIVHLDIQDILYMFSHKSVVHYQTRDGVYSKITTFEEEERFLLEHGFQKVDRCYVVQMDQVEYYDEDTHSLYFDRDPVNKDSISAPVSRAHKKDVAGIPTKEEILYRQKLANANG